MTKQRETPDLPNARAFLEQKLGRPLGKGDFVSGTQFQDFRKGWAVHIAASRGSKKAHYFERTDFTHARSLCGVEAQVRWLHGPGNYPECSHCIEKRCKR